MQDDAKDAIVNVKEAGFPVEELSTEQYASMIDDLAEDALANIKMEALSHMHQEHGDVVKNMAVYTADDDEEALKKVHPHDLMERSYLELKSYTDAVIELLLTTAERAMLPIDCLAGATCQLLGALYLNTHMASDTQTEDDFAAMLNEENIAAFQASMITVYRREIERGVQYLRDKNKVPEDECPSSPMTT